MCGSTFLIIFDKNNYLQLELSFSYNIVLYECLFGEIQTRVHVALTSRSITARLGARSILLPSISFHMDLSDSCGWIERGGNAMNSGKRVSLLSSGCQSGERVKRVVLLQRRENATELLRFPAHKYSQGPRLYNKSIASVSNTHSHTHTGREIHSYNQQSAHTHTHK